MNIFKWFQRDTMRFDNKEKLRLLTESIDSLRSRATKLKEFSAYLNFKLDYIKDTELDMETRDVLYQGCVIQTKYYLALHHELKVDNGNLDKQIQEFLHL